MSDKFKACAAVIFREEGGYANIKGDRGGPTNMGITWRTLESWRRAKVSVADVKALSQEEARAIYRAHYWNAVRGDELWSGVDLMVFNAAVLSGRRQAIIWLQRCLKLPEDGAAGPQTMGALGLADPRTLVAAYARIQLAGMRGMPSWPQFGEPWTNRINRVKRDALAMVEPRVA